MTQRPEPERLAGQSPKRRRLPALDFTKGTLVLIMVLYHWLNYFVSPDGEFYKYLRFLTPSFIFISGFVISLVYFGGDGIHDRRVPRRLVQRGTKILLLFVLLNVARFFLVPDARGGTSGAAPWAGGNLITVFVSGNVAVDGNSKATAFNILVPISYLLILSAGLVVLCRVYRYAFHVTCLLFMLSILVLRLNGVGSGNLELIAIGLLGVVLGYVPIDTFSRLVRHRAAIAAAYLAYLAVLTFWHINYVLQLIGVCLNLLVIYMLGEQGDEGLLRKHVILLGKYSLFGYIAQIAILQALRRGLRHADLGAVPLLIVSFVTAFAFTSLAVEIADRARRRMPSVDRLYNVVFA